MNSQLVLSVLYHHHLPLTPGTPVHQKFHQSSLCQLKYIIKTFQILFGEEGGEHRTISFLNAVFNLKSHADKIKSIRYLKNTSPIRGCQDIDFDVRIEVLCTTFDGHHFIVQMQKAATPKHSNCWVYYGARELVALGY